MLESSFPHFIIIHLLQGKDLGMQYALVFEAKMPSSKQILLLKPQAMDSLLP